MYRQGRRTAAGEWKGDRELGMKMDCETNFPYAREASARRMYPFGSSDLARSL
jgi:hypothetical protein